MHRPTFRHRLNYPSDTTCRSSVLVERAMFSPEWSLSKNKSLMKSYPFTIYNIEPHLFTPLRFRFKSNFDTNAMERTPSTTSVAGG